VEIEPIGGDVIGSVNECVNGGHNELRMCKTEEVCAK